MNPLIKECLDLCLLTHRTCLETVPHCLRSGGDLADPAVVQLLLNCAEICQMTSHFLMSQTHSEMQSEVAETCAFVCEECATTFARFASDPVLASCAEICQRCSESCDRLSGKRVAA